MERSGTADRASLPPLEAAQLVADTAYAERRERDDGLIGGLARQKTTR